jgi:hypothetical protein
VIDVHCNGRLRDGTRCQEICHADESHVGQSIRCPKCGAVNRIERSLPVQSGYPSGTGPVRITSAEGRPTRRVSRSTVGLSRPTKAAILAGVLLGVFGIAVVLDRLWPDSPSKSGAESPSTPKQSVAPSLTAQPHDIQPPLIEPNPPIPNPWRTSGNLAPAQPSPDNLASFPATNGAAHPIPIPPCAQGQQAERLHTGARIEPDGEASGLSELSVSNGTRSDAAVRLVDGSSGDTARFVYIEAGHLYTLTGIQPGTYTLRFILGREWVPACRDFLEAEYSEFESALVFKDVTKRKQHIQLAETS